MLIGYIRVSKIDGLQKIDLQEDALFAAGVESQHIYVDKASGKKEDRPGLNAALKAIRPGDTLVVWKLDRLGRSLRHVIEMVHELEKRGIGIKVLAGAGAVIDTTTPAGRMVLAIFAALAEFEHDLISERTKAGLSSARARGNKGGAPCKMTRHKLRFAMVAMSYKETKVTKLCQELHISRQTLYRYVSPDGTLREAGKNLLNSIPLPVSIRKL